MAGLFLTIQTHAGPVIAGRCLRVLSDCSMLLRTTHGLRIVFQFEMAGLVACNKTEG